jgi:Zn-dependent M16 (insulinase) family peptidase
MLMRRTGRLSFYSYRDPKPERTYGEFTKSGDFLREYAKRGEPLQTLIIGALGNILPLITPRASVDLALSRYLSGFTYEEEKRIINELLSTNEEDLLALADTIDAVCQGSALCLVGNREHISACKDRIERILEL